MLTDKGLLVAEEIRSLIHTIQEIADTGISQEDLAVFYQVLDRLAHNLQSLPPDLL